MCLMKVLISWFYEHQFVYSCQGYKDLSVTSWRFNWELLKYTEVTAGSHKGVAV